ncbi:MAG: hypothetical protein ACXAC6_03810 [Candidatus Hodarchaeales archaeon]|jgi:hypothetical protein
MDYINIFDLQIPLIPLIVFLFELVLVCSLLIGWYFGARRLNLTLHHWMVYSISSIHLIIWLIWMFPKALNALPFVLSDPFNKMLPFLHYSVGLIAIISSLTLVVIFIFNQDIPLNLLRRLRPLMIVTLICWTIAFTLGFLIFLIFKIETIPDDPYYSLLNLILNKYF